MTLIAVLTASADPSPSPTPGGSGAVDVALSDYYLAVGLLVVLGAVTAFGLLIESTGLLLAVVATILLGGLASRESRPLELAALAVGLAAFCAGLFVYGLGLPIPLWPPR